MDDAPKAQSIPSDDQSRELARAQSDDPNQTHVSVVGDTYTILVDGKQTNGRHCLIDMHVPPGGGPPPHRHDFEETFCVLEGEITVTFRDKEQVVKAGQTVNVPANAPHSFTNAADSPARLFCFCSPAGQEEFFLAIGDRVSSRTAPPPDLSEDEKAEREERAKALAPQYKTEIL